MNALERTGQARAAATDSGIDFSTAYARRRAHGDFADAWRQALNARKARVATENAEELKAVRRAPLASPSELGEELVVSAGQVKRASPERWGRRKQAAYLAELAATANHRRASAAIGMSYQGVLRRRRTDPCLEAACEQAIADCAAQAPAFLASAMVATFDPEALPGDAGDALPKMTIDQAIRISQLHSAARAEPQEPPPSIEDVRARLEKKMRALGLIRDRPRDGWSYDEDHGCEVPPGWVRAESPD